MTDTPDIAPPRAQRRPRQGSAGGPATGDPFAWMRGTDDPALLTYLAAENDWCERSTTHLAGLRADLERDLAAILPDDDVSAPWRLGRC